MSLGDSLQSVMRIAEFDEPYDVARLISLKRTSVGLAAIATDPPEEISMAHTSNIPPAGRVGATHSTLGPGAIAL